MVMLARTVADSKSINNVIENCWREMQSIHHYDYTFSLIPSEEMPEKTGQFWLVDQMSPVIVSVLHPTIGFLYESRQDLNISLPIMGKWSSTPTSLENAWRALNHYAYPVMMDVLLKATYLRPDELIAYDKLLNDLKLVVDASDSITNRAQAGQWLDMMKNCISKFASVYMMQVRLATSGDMLSYLPRAIGTAPTFQSALEQSLPFQGFHVVSRRGVDAHDWALRISELEFIDLDIALPPQLTNFPFYATTSEALSVSRFVFSPKGGIPDLVLE